MAQTSAGRSPIPPANNGDPEDVAWALSTAEAMYARGDRGEALKWLRRAAEAGAEGKIGDRAVQLARAAAELAGMLGPASGSDSPAFVRTQSSRPAGARAHPPPPPSHGPPPARAPASISSAPPVAPSPLRVAASGAFRRAASSVAPGTLGTQEAEEPARMREPPPRDDSPDASPVLSRAPDFSIPDLLHDDLADPPEEKTRIGVPAYQAGAMAAADAPVSPKVADPSLRPTQAMRVIVWRGPDGVHVAPYGTHVAAIAVDALLVALDPAADLAAWLSKK